MRRISLDKRLGRHRANRAVIDVLVHMSVVDYLRAVAPVNGSSLNAFVRLRDQMKQAGADVDRAMCNTVVNVARTGYPTCDEILFGLLVEPIYKLQRAKEANHEHTVCDTRDSDGPDQDDHGGRELPSP